MIRQSPEVPAAVELADVSRHIMNNEFIFTDPSRYNSWYWQSPSDFDPMLGVMVPQKYCVERNGRFIITQANLAIVEVSMEHWVNVPIRGADKIEDNQDLIDFVVAFRQYNHGRSEIILPND